MNKSRTASDGASAKGCTPPSTLVGGYCTLDNWQCLSTLPIFAVPNLCGKRSNCLIKEQMDIERNARYEAILKLR